MATYIAELKPFEPGGTTVSPPHVLLVDDAAFRDLVALRLRLLGCSCTPVRSVPDAILSRLTAIAA